MRLMNVFTAFSFFCGFTIGVCLRAAGLSPPFSGLRLCHGRCCLGEHCSRSPGRCWLLLLLLLRRFWLLLFFGSSPGWAGFLFCCFAFCCLLPCCGCCFAFCCLLPCCGCCFAILLLVALLWLLFVVAWRFFLTLVWLVWLALVRSLVAVFLSAVLGAILSGLAVSAVTASVVSSVCAFLLRLVELDVFRTFAASLRERHFVYHLLQELSICWNQYWSSSLTKVMALPSRLARAVRPMR